MSNLWLRLWHDMPNDPKWRTIAKISGQKISDVIAVYIHVLVSASMNQERGVTQCNAEDITSALDLTIECVEAIFKAMQGRVLDGNYVSGWETRQPKREDNSKARVEAHRERNAEKRSVTQCNSRIDKEEDKNNKKVSIGGSRFALTQIPEDWRSFSLKERADLIPEKIFEQFSDYWMAVPGQKGRKSNWFATWRNWIRNQKLDLGKKTETIEQQFERVMANATG